MFHYVYSIYMMYYKQQHHSLTLKHHHCIVLYELLKSCSSLLDKKIMFAIIGGNFTNLKLMG